MGTLMVIRQYEQKQKKSRNYVRTNAIHDIKFVLRMSSIYIADRKTVADCANVKNFWLKTEIYFDKNITIV